MDDLTFEIKPSEFSLEDTLNNWPSLNEDARKELFFSLNRTDAEELFLNLSANYQIEIYEWIPASEKRTWIRMLDPDDIVDLIQEMSKEIQPYVLNLLDNTTRIEVEALLAYEEDEAGGLMNSRFTRLRHDMTAESAIRYLRAQSKGKTETIYYGYVCDHSQVLKGVVSLRQLFGSHPDSKIEDIMNKELITVSEETDQETIAKTFTNVNLMALPVVDINGVMKGIVTLDDIVNVVQDEATEDIQKIGGTEALDEPYLEIGFLKMIKKRAGWLLILFVSEMFTASAMSYYEGALAKAVVLALFIPLVISSGGNSGSQATTLIIRALAIGEVKLGDWWKVFRREVGSGIVLGVILAAVGFLRISFWPNRVEVYGEHYYYIAMAVSFSLIGIVLWGTIVGSMLPFILKKCKLDPATASAPFVATLVDVTGLIIYFSIASFVLKGILI